MNTEQHVASTTPHEHVTTLLPWHVNRTLTSEEAHFVQEHLKDCDPCRTEAKLAYALQHAATESSALIEAPLPDIERAFAKISKTLDAMQREPPLRRWLRQFPPTLRAPSKWWVSALAVQFTVILGLGVLLISHDQVASPYRVLAASPKDTANIIIVFQPNTTLADMQRILRASGANVVNGPTITDAYLLSVPAGQLSQALARLREEAAVVLVESMTARSGN